MSITNAATEFKDTASIQYGEIDLPVVGYEHNEGPLRLGSVTFYGKDFEDLNGCIAEVSVRVIRKIDPDVWALYEEDSNTWWGNRETLEVFVFRSEAEALDAKRAHLESFGYPIQLKLSKILERHEGGPNGAVLMTWKLQPMESWPCQCDVPKEGK